MSLAADSDQPKSGRIGGAKELPDKRDSAPQLTKDQYFRSIKGRNMPRNMSNILQRGTPDGSNAAPYGETIERAQTSFPDGDIDPNRIRSLTDPLSALPFRYAGYGLEGGVLFGYGQTAKVSKNSLGLIRKAQLSYQNRQSILEPRASESTADTSGFTKTKIPDKPPSYAEATGDIDAYKDTGTDLDETYS